MTWLVAGLGNPGAKYECTRHNVGFLIADALAEKFGDGNFQKAHSGLLAKLAIKTHSAVVLKPQTFMNLSGTSVQAAASFYKVPVSDIIVVHDDLDLPFGALRLKKGGGHGGHNGLKDITRLLGPEFIRVRVGIGRPHIKGTEADYVLAPYKNQEIPALEEQIVAACQAIEKIMDDGLESAQRYFNPRS